MALPMGSAVLDKRITFHEYRYSTDDDSFETAYKFKSSWGINHPEYIAEDAAEHYHNGSGWENTWPVDIKIWNSDGTILGKFDVDRDFNPVFNARRLP
jgi:hypothetical protein